MAHEGKYNLTIKLTMSRSMHSSSVLHQIYTPKFIKIRIDSGPINEITLPLHFSGSNYSRGKPSDVYLAGPIINIPRVAELKVDIEPLNIDGENSWQVRANKVFTHDLNHKIVTFSIDI